MGEEFYPMMNHRVLTILELDDFGGVISVSFELKFGWDLDFVLAWDFVMAWDFGKCDGLSTFCIWMAGNLWGTEDRFC